MTNLFSDDKQKVAIGFEKVTLRQTKDGDRIAKMRFAVRLEGDVLVHCPPEIRAAYEAVDTRENKITKVELDKEIPGVTIEFYALPDARAITAQMNSVNLLALEVERDETKGRAIPHLTFSIEIAVDDSTKLRYWLVDNIFTQLWAQMTVAQMTLIAPATDAAAEKRVN